MPGYASRLFRREPVEPVRPELPEMCRIYCIGDIHGRLDLLLRLHDLIRADATGYQGSLTCIYLGDYVDRGMESRGVIDCLLQQPLDGFDAVHLLGNHEQAMLDFLQHPHAVAGWLGFGGLATLHSYGVPIEREGRYGDLEELRDDLSSRLPATHLEFLRSLQLSYVAGSYCFVHAGLRPGISLDEQRPDDLLWIREDFTLNAARHEYVVVHGHTIVPAVEFRPNRIGIDTGAFHTGVLTCLVLEGADQRLLQTGA